MKDKNKKKKQTKEGLELKNYPTREAAEEAAEEYLNNKPFYTVLNIFIGDAKVKTVKSNVDGTPPKY